MLKMDVLSNLGALNQPKIDSKDKQILSLLDDNARLSYAYLSKKTKLSKDAVRYRISNLQKKDILQGTRAIIDTNKLGFGSYHIFLQFNHLDNNLEKKIITKLQKRSFIKAILSFSGKYDLELAIVAKTVNDLDLAIETIISDCENYIQNFVVLTLTNNYLNRSLPLSFYKKNISKQNKVIKKKKQEIKLDTKDRAILNELSNDATKHYYQIGINVDLSADAVTRRIRKMQNFDLIKKFVPVINYSKIGYGTYCLLIQIKNLTHDKKLLLKELLIEDQNVIWAVHCIGNYNLLIYLSVNDTKKVHSTLSSLRNHFPESCSNYEILIADKEYKYTYLPDL